MGKFSLGSAARASMILLSAAMLAAAAPATQPTTQPEAMDFVEFVKTIPPEMMADSDADAQSMKEAEAWRAAEMAKLPQDNTPATLRARAKIVKDANAMLIAHSDWRAKLLEWSKTHFDGKTFTLTGTQDFRSGPGRVLTMIDDGETSYRINFAPQNAAQSVAGDRATVTFTITGHGSIVCERAKKKGGGTQINVLVTSKTYTLTPAQ